MLLSTNDIASHRVRVKRSTMYKLCNSAFRMKDTRFVVWSLMSERILFDYNIALILARHPDEYKGEHLIELKLSKTFEYANVPSDQIIKLFPMFGNVLSNNDY